MMTNQQIIELVTAHTNGNKIQYLARHDNAKWTDVVGNPCWAFNHYDYRVKPEPREWVLVKNTDCHRGSKIDGADGWHVYYGDCNTDNYPAIRVREVLE